jgi:hypothetical protein
VYVIVPPEPVLSAAMDVPAVMKASATQVRPKRFFMLISLLLTLIKKHTTRQICLLLYQKIPNATTYDCAKNIFCFAQSALDVFGVFCDSTRSQ